MTLVDDTWIQIGRSPLFRQGDIYQRPMVAVNQVSLLKNLIEWSEFRIRNEALRTPVAHAPDGRRDIARRIGNTQVPYVTQRPE